jgi:hypothetical protein
LYLGRCWERNGNGNVSGGDRRLDGRCCLAWPLSKRTPRTILMFLGYLYRSMGHLVAMMGTTGVKHIIDENPCNDDW